MKTKRKPPPGSVVHLYPTYQTSVGMTTSKRGHLVQYSSRWEHLLVLRFERDATVIDYMSRPLTIEYLDPNGELCSATPNFWVLRTNGDEELHLVSVGAQSRREREREALAAITEYCAQRGLPLFVHTEITLPNKTEGANLIALAGFRASVNYNEQIDKYCRKTLGQRAPELFHVLVRSIAEALKLDPPMVRNNLLHLLWHGMLETDWQKLIFDNGQVLPDMRVALAQELRG